MKRQPIKAKVRRAPNGCTVLSYENGVESVYMTPYVDFCAIFGVKNGNVELDPYENHVPRPEDLIQ